MDPGYGYPQQYQVPQQDPQYADPNAGYVDPNAQAPQTAPTDPNDPYAQAPAEDDSNYGTEPVTDAQIDSTLDGYGSWIDDEDYGRIWVPSATAVGVDFTPYETAGSWVYSDSGWMFDCDYSWGWLPFHYGRWGWFDGYWGWVPGYNWGPAWVDWRYGGGYVGWRPMAPGFRDGHFNVRDHRHEARVMDSHWRFAAEHDMSRPHIASHTFQNPAEGLRVTQPMRPPHPQGITPVHSAQVMRGRMPPRVATGTNPGSRPFTPGRPTAVPQRGIAQPPQRGWQAPQQPRGPQTYGPYRNPQAFQQYRGPAQVAPQRPYMPPQRPYQAPQRPYQAPQQAYRPPVNTYRPPVQSYSPPVNTYRPPVQSYRPPVNTYRPPAPSYHAPSYSAPSHSYSAPSHSYSAPSHSYSAPSHSSGGGGGGGGFHGGGGGGHHR
jgi:hypothetical protein